MLVASLQWPGEGEPENPHGWLIRVATRRLTDQIRANAARRYREQIVVSLISPEDQIALAADAAMASERDETLELYFMCCHPSHHTGIGSAVRAEFRFGAFRPTGGRATGTVLDF
jgi:predicted RNA polymerase sigma factor